MNQQHVPAANWTRPLPAQQTPGGHDRSSSRAGEPPLATLGDMLAAVRRRWKPLALWIAICLVSAAYYLHITPPEFSSAATVILEERRQPAATADSAAMGGPSSLDNAQAESQLQVMRSERILSSVFDVLDLRNAPELADQGPGLKERLLGLLGLNVPLASDPETAETDARARAFQAFSDRVGVRRIGQSYVLEVSYRARSPDQAARIANALTSAYIGAQVDLKAAAAQNGSEYLRDRIAYLKTEQDAAFEGVRQGGIPSILFPDADARVIGAALRPLGKASPQTALTLGFALAFGLLTGLLVIAIQQALDRSLSTSAQAHHALGVDVLGLLPEVARRGEIRASRGTAMVQAVSAYPDSAFAQAVRAIRTAVLLGLPDGRHRAIGIVSLSPGEGRTTLASNLAHLMAASGDPVELIDGDLQQPTLTAYLAPQASSGLNEALVDHRGLARLQSVHLTDHFGFIPAVAAGRTSEPNVYFGSADMQTLLSRLLEKRDVVIDLPPLATSSDVQALSHLLDGVVLVVEVGRTTVDEALEAMRVLRAANAVVLGVVLNRAKLEGAKRRRRHSPPGDRVEAVADRRG